MPLVILMVLFFRDDVFSEKVRYDGSQVWRVNLQGGNISSDLINKIEEQVSCDVKPRFSKDVWRWDSDSIDFLIRRNETDQFYGMLRTHNVSYNVFLNNLQEKIDEENKIQAARRAGDKMTDKPWTYYAKLSEINAYLAKVAAANPSVCTLSTVGTTLHKKPIKMLKISNSKRHNAPFLIDGGIHGREWASVASVLYVIDTIAWNFTKQPYYITQKDWYIIPVVNPDGYEYSMTKDRMWRKNRRRFSGPCDGVDINRNFALGWGERGASNIICSDGYCGPEPFSEEESKTIKSVLESTHFHLYVSVHSYGSAVYLPWIMSGRSTKENESQMRLAQEMSSAMHAVINHFYIFGHAHNKKKSAGISIDWAYNKEVIFTYIIETRGSNHGGYFLDPKELRYAVKEVYAGIYALAQNMVW